MVCKVFYESLELGYCWIGGLFFNTPNYTGMAGRINITRTIRVIHLVSSMVLLVFLMMYTITGILITHKNLAHGEPRVIHSKVLMEKPFDNSSQEYARYLKKEYGFKGKYGYREYENGNREFSFNFPGEWVKVNLTPSMDTLHIQYTETERTLRTVAHNLHGMRGFKGGWVYVCWAIFYDLSAAALILFGITGILMWLRAKKRFPFGWWFLAAGILVPLAIVLAFLFSR